MAQISLKEISETLAEDKWQVVSDKYVNLNTIMEFKCSEGHQVFSTWGKIRKKRICPVCVNNHFKDPKPILTSKSSNTQRVLALDQATHLTGWAIFDNDKLITYGVYSVKAEEEEERLHEINMWLISMIQNWMPDMIGIEGIQYQQNIGITTFQTLARLQGILMETCMQAEIPYKICPTNTWRAHCGVKGKARADKKKSMQLIVKQLYDVSVSDDCADAIGIGKYVAETKIKQLKVINWE